MATGEASRTSRPVIRKPLHLLPKFTSEIWAEGTYDMEHGILCPSLYIREDDLLTYSQKIESETRSLIFQYQLKYADKEYELLKKEFQEIEERLNQEEASEAPTDEHVFAKPTAPVVKKPGKKAAKSAKNLTSSQSSSETEKGTSADEQVVSDDQATQKGRGRPKRGEKVKKSGSETEDKGNSADEPVVSEKSARKTSRQRQAKSKSGSEELTSSQEAERPARPRRKSRRNL